MYKLSNKSRSILNTVQEPLIAVVERAIEITDVDFGVQSGNRTLSEQKRLVAQGASKTLDSKHIGGRAVDLVAYVDGKYTYDWQYYYSIAKAMQAASKELNIPIRWGGCWDYITEKEGDPKQWVDAYVAHRKAQSKSAFIDGVHFDLG